MSIRKATQGFTIIEMIMVMVVVAILSAVAIPQYINFRTEAKIAKTQMYLGAIRSGIANQVAQIALRCTAATTAFPVLADLNANDVTTTTCTVGEVVSTAERKFITDTLLPATVLGAVLTNEVVDCVIGQCARVAGCGAAGVYTSKWCYNVANGDFWLDIAAYRTY